MILFKMERMFKRKIENYVKSNKIGRLERFLLKYPSLLNAPLNKRGHRGLHLCVRKRRCDCMYVYLKLGASAIVRDGKGCIPLHYALKRAIKVYSDFTVADYVEPLMQAAGCTTSILNRPNKKGTTCATLFEAMQVKAEMHRERELGSRIRSLSSSSSSDGSAEEGSSPVDWNKKLSQAASEDLEAEFGAAESQFYWNQEKLQENYNEWADRIWKEYQRQRQNQEAKINSHKNIKDEPKKQARVLKKKTPVVTKVPLSEKYLSFREKVLSNTSCLSDSDIPFDAHTSASDIVTALVASAEQLKEENVPKYLKKELRIWHPDKVNKLMSFFTTAQSKQKIKTVAIHVTKSLISYANEL